MSPTVRSVAAAGAACALVSGIGTVAHAAQRARPDVAYARIHKHCSTYEMDGVKQKQCIADFTVVVTGIDGGDEVSVVGVNRRHGIDDTVATVTATSTRARTRVTSAVVAFGRPAHLSVVRYHVEVVDASGDVVYTSQPHTF